MLAYVMEKHALIRCHYCISLAMRVTTTTTKSYEMENIPIHQPWYGINEEGLILQLKLLAGAKGLQVTLIGSGRYFEVPCVTTDSRFDCPGQSW